LQEVRQLNSGAEIIEINDDFKYEFHWSGYAKKREAGVGILIRSCKDIVIEEVNYINPTLLTAAVIFYVYRLKVIVAYAPPNCENDVGTREQQNNAFYADLHKVTVHDTKHQKLVILADMNATTDLSLKLTKFDGNETNNNVAQPCQ
jgi:exonuclease III